MAGAGTAPAAVVRGSIDARDLDDALAAVRRLGDPLASLALADALNHTANQARIALRVDMEDVFKSPTPWVLNSIFMKSATAASLEAALWVKDGKLPGASRGFDEWFNPQVAGVSRLSKGWEKALRARGILPAGSFIIPTASTPRDGRGGIKRKWMQDLVKSFSGGGRGAFFVIKRGRYPIGIAERLGEGRKNIRVVLQFSRAAPLYRERFKFHAVVRRVAENDAQLETNINKAIADALNGRLPSQRRVGR